MSVGYFNRRAGAMLLTIDIGNSSLGVAVFEGDIIINHRVFPIDCIPQDLFESINRSFGGKLAGVMVASVVPFMNGDITRMVKDMGHKEPIFIHHRMNLGFSLKISQPQTLGADRISNCSGGFYFSEPPFIIVDSGTATNFEVVNKDGEFIGGSIFPGIDMGMNSLTSRAAQLDKAPFHVPESPVGKSTPECMRSGIYYAQLGGIQYLIQRYKEEVGTNAAVFATGGGMTHFIKDLKDTVSYEPCLIFYGMKRIFDRISKSRERDPAESNVV